MAYLYTIDAGSNLFIWKWVNETTTAYDNMREAKKRARNNAKGKHNHEEQAQRVQENLSEFEEKITEGRFILSAKKFLNQGGFLKRAVFKANMGFLACTHTNGKFSIWRLIG